MGDLVKFVRQQFFDNNWTKSVDSNSLSEEKLECIDTSFAHMDVKSKLCLLLAFSNMKPSPVEKINKHIESIFLQALDEENNLVKAVATILHSKQTLNYLNFDISPTNEAFGKNIDKLLKSANSWSIVETPLLAEYLGSNVLDTFLSVKKSDSSEKEPNECGFRRRGKLESEHLKETYLEKLKDECQRRRVHVPIPGRSFARQDETEESITSEEVNNSGNSTNVSQSDSTSSKRKSTFPRISDRNSARLESKRSPVWSRNNLNKVGNNGENKPMSISDRINNRSSAMSAVRKPSGIKLLEFDELPAFGPKAKQLRKEKEREERLKLKQEKEERAREMKAAREASKLARQSERQALLEARKQNMFNPSLWSVNNHDEFSENIRTGGIQGVGGVGSGVGGSGDGMLPVVCRTSEFMNFNSSSISENRQSFTVLSKNFVANSQQSISNRVQYPGNFVNYTSMMNLPNRLISPKMNTDSKPVIHHPLLSASANTNSGNYVEYADDEDEEDDDDDDDDDDYDMMQNPESGTSCSIGFTNNFSFKQSFGVNMSGLQPATVSASSSARTFQCSVPAVSQAGVYTLSSNQSESTDKLPVSSLQQQAQPVQYLPFSNPSVSKSPSSTVSIAPAPVNHIRLIRPNVSQSTTTTGGVIKVVNAPSSDTPVRIICLMDQNTSKPTQNVIMQSGNPSNTDKLNESITHGSHENLALSSESPTYPVPTSGTQMLSPQRLVSIPSESSPVKIINSPVQPIRPRSDTTTGSLVCIAPRPPRIIQLSSANNSMFENTVTTQPILSSPGANRMYLSTSAYPAQQQQPQQQAASVGVIRPSNSTIVLDGRPIVFASPATRLTSPPAAPALRPQPVQRISVVASRPTVQSPTNQTYIQILPRPTVTTTQARPTNVAVLKPLNQSKIPMDSTDSTSSSASSAQITPTRQVIVSNAYNSINSGNNNLSSNINSNSNNNNVSNPCTIAPASIITSLSNYNSNQLTSGVIISQGGDVVQSSQPPSTPIVTGNIVVSSNTSSSNSSTSTNLSSVKIQDDLCLTESQLSVVQSLFQDANRVTRPEKAMIISFIAGSRDNPRPETGQITRIRLSEYRERVLNQTTGQLMDLAVDTYLTMDYSTGKYEKVKCYRTDTPENLAKDTTASGFIGPLTQAEYEQLYPRNDKPDLLAEVAAEENEWVEFERTDEKEAVQAGTAAWAPLKPPFIDSHFSIWSLSESISASQLYLGGKLPPPVTADWGKILRQDYTADDYEEEIDYMRVRAENELKYEVGELSPVRYAIHVQVASTYSESLMISSLAEDYYCIAGYVGWCDLSDPSLSDHIRQMSNDPLLVGLRYDVSEMDGDYILDSMVDSNFAAIEHQQLVFDLAVGPHQLRHACHLAYRHPKLKLVLNHCGLPVEFTASRPEDNLALKNWRSDLELLSRYPNVYCKVTGATGRIQKSPSSSSNDDTLDAYSIDQWCASSALSHAISCFGPDRCLFGSGWPVCRLFKPSQTGWPEQASASDLHTYDIPGELAAKRSRRSVPLKVLNLWETARLVEHAMGDAGYGSIEDKEKIFSKNAQKVYSLSIRPYGSCSEYKPKE